MSDYKVELPAKTVNIRNLPAGDYVLSKALKDAVEVALTLEQPLLITGEPGTGKTRLAYRIAKDLAEGNDRFLDEPLEFNTQTTAIASDLFYYYDALSHFHDVNLKQTAGEAAPPVSDYIELRALGKALALSNPEMAGAYGKKGAKPRSSVVLIDEIDKAPRDFPNNLLAGLEKFSFTIREDSDHTIKLGEGQKVVVIITSNSEKTLPEAFLRRCVFFHIPFPGPAELMRIVKAHLGDQSAYSSEQLIEHFREIRRRVRRKKPATAELVAWLRVLEINKFLEGGVNFNELSDAQKETLKISYSVLAKTTEDLDELLKTL